MDESYQDLEEPFQGGEALQHSKMLKSRTKTKRGSAKVKKPPKPPKPAKPITIDVTMYGPIAFECGFKRA